MKHILSFLFLLFSFQLGMAQQYASTWYFGDYAGIDFSSGSPVALTNSGMFQHEGCAAISDDAGNILFYTNGMEVWNANHSLMPNGTDLMGHVSAAQSGIIVPRPGNQGIYYIFTVDAEISSIGLRYSTVDMSLNSGLGDITSEKNIFLAQPTEEKVTAVQHANGQDIWVITHLWDSDEFQAFLVTSSGVNNVPVVSNAGSYHTGVEGLTHSCMKFSPDGTRLAVVTRHQNSIELFDFDASTGRVSNAIAFASMYQDGYGLEFSRSGNKLYLSKYGGGAEIYQWDLSTAGTGEAGTLVGTVNNIHVGSLQIAPDGKIYVAKMRNVSPIASDPYLGVIQSPEETGTACNYVNDGFYLGGRGSRLGLPTFIQSYMEATVIANDVCEGDSVQFILNINTVPDSVRWIFGDPASGSQNTSSGVNPSHLYSGSGVYHFNVTVYAQNNSSTIYDSVEVFPAPDVNIGPDTTICQGDEIRLDAGQGNADYLWSNGEITSEIRVQSPGQYWVEVTNTSGCTTTDSMNLEIVEVPDLSLGEDIGTCNDFPILLSAQDGFDHYLWQDSSDQQEYMVNAYDYYWVQAEYSGCKVSDTIVVFEECYTTIFFPNVFTPNDDGINDSFFPVYENISRYKLYVFNRWGQLIYESENPDQGWDGRFKGRDCPEGVYVFLAEYENYFTGITESITGSFSLLR